MLLLGVGLGLNRARRLAGGAGGGLIQDGLVAHYKFDEGSGQVLNDSGPNGWHGTLGGSGASASDDPTWDAEGLVFASSGDMNFARFPFTAERLPTGASTYQWLVKITTVSFWGSHIGQLPSGTAPRPWWDGSQLRIRDGGDIITVNHGGTHTSWHLLTFTYAAGDQKLYRNATQIGTAALTKTFAGSNDGYRIGSVDQFDRLSGKAGYFALYNRPLTADEVTANYNTIKTEVAARGIALP